MTKRIYHPDLVLTERGFESGRAVVVNNDGRIEAIVPAKESEKHEAVRLVGKALLPGFANAHSHTFQRLIRGRTETRGASGDDFWTWREAMYRAANSVDADDVYHVARMAFLEMVMAGTTTVGEFHYLHRAQDRSAYPDPNLLSRKIIAAAESVGLRIALLRVAYARAGYELPPHAGQARFYETPQEYLENTAVLAAEFMGEKVWVGVAPHSIRAVPLAQLEEIAAWARERGLVVHMHAAEQVAELAACRREYGATPIQLLAERGLLSSKMTLVHAIHITETEMDALAAADTVICSCPTTERNLGDGIIDAARAAQRGIRFAFGSDSETLIDPLEDAREIEYHLRLQIQKRVVLDEIGGRNLSQRLFQYATEGGAQALGFDSGVIAIGRPADFFAVDLGDPSIAGNSPEDLLASIVFGLSRTAIRDVMVGGEHILRDGRHPLQEEIVNSYQSVYRKVWQA
ncbi:formimidoylglutamate deiminase [Silvibacterium bohemicum]|uniref:Formimidoylglutamate deiminase n=1 Tax=Silvibacterium bohemicum TaxID=1577686 RepID=A0A841JYX5_9BACT|nr:formimidoylglutamate deiminase [Silvibacterium bohemicum]MBB6145607.1 formimidoylglutamate deiminase [Silvibacterium bohemicum]